MHRLIVQSNTYTQVSAWRAALHASARQEYPDNRSLCRQRLRRLAGEPMRDTVLAISGAPNRQMVGPPAWMIRGEHGETGISPSPDGDR